MVITIPVGPYATNAYIYCNEATRAGIVIDPASDAQGILDRAKAHGVDIRAVLITHGHFDHIGAVDEIRAALNVPVYASRLEANLAKDASQNGTQFFGMRPITATVDNFLSEEGAVDFGGVTMHVLATPGHTLGSLCFYVPEENALFAGDTLFKESYGRYDLPTGDYTELISSLERLLALPEETVVYPGHGPATTIGYERINNLIRK